MAFAGLGSWLGKPKQKATTSPPNHASEANSSRSASHERHGNESDGSRGKDSNSSIGDSIHVGTPDNANDTIIAQGFHIDLPVVSDSEDFEHLPGHFTARRVLSRLQGPKERFRVKLQSDETQIFTRMALLKLQNGQDALEQFEKQDMDISQKRNSRRLRPSGFIDPAELDLSDGNDSEQPSRRSRRRGGKSRETSASSSLAKGESEASSEDELVALEEPSTSDNEVPSSAASRTLGRRSGRLSNRRQLRLHPSAVPIASDDSSDELMSLASRKTRKRKSPPTKQASRRKRSALRRSSSSDCPTPARRSQRTLFAPRLNMRERQEDEISEKEEERVGPKILTTKEVFKILPETDDFRRRHRQVCDTCHQQGDRAEKGPLVFCQGCTVSYHKACLGPRGSRDHLVSKVGHARFVLQCRRCLGVGQTKDRNAPHHGECTGCRQVNVASQPFRARLTTRQEQVQREENGGQDPITFVNPDFLDNVANVMFRCATCQRAWHLNHLPPRKIDIQYLEEDDELLDEASLGQKRFDEYHRAWLCKDCHAEKSEIDTLVAWRPSDEASYIPGVTNDMMSESDKQYLIKWKRQSHFHTTWMPGSWVWGVAASSMRAAFMKKEENSLPKMTTEDAVPEAYLRVDIVFDVHYSSIVSNRSLDIDHARIREVTEVYVKFKGLGYEDALWEKPPSPSDNARWADFKIAYEDWCLMHYVHVPNRSRLQKHLSATREKDFETQLLKDKQPSIMNGGELMDYQIEGMNWLYYQWFKGQNAILADEMGLGKTIQLISFFATLVQDHKNWPFLVVVPNSTCPNWRREIKKWVASLRVVTYYGSAAARKLAHDKELFPSGPQDLRAHIVVTSYDCMVEDRARLSLSKIPWAGLVVDEGQRLKNEKNLLYEALQKIKFPYIVLLTGTPLQNNARELFNLLQFLDRRIDAAKLEVEYGELTKENVPQLHELIRPFFLRRTKAQVLKDLPPIAQVILPITMTSLQKKVYKSILAKNPQLMKSIFARDGSAKQTERANLNNILMQLRKTLCHPFVYSRQIEERSYDPVVAQRNLVDASAKLQLLELMLPRLQERGHRVLIFSQFLNNLDIVEDFLDGLGLQHHRLDGTINSLEKQKRIDEFNAPNSPFFAFLLSTRAGGVGINLATADTVIIMDPDFNPHQDIQALSRAHRIGQTRKVLVYQIMTRGSAEEKIMQIGKKKMALDHVLIQSMDDPDDAGRDLESILRHGAEALFDDNDATEDIKYDTASIEKLLDRSQTEDTVAGEDTSAESQFSFARVWANDKTALQDNLGNPDEASAPNLTIWDKILKERERAAEEEEAAKAQAFGRGKRRRGNVDYSTQEGVEQDLFSPQKNGQNPDAGDQDFQAQGSDAEDDTGTEGALDDFSAQELDDRSPTKKRLSSRPSQPTVRARPFRRVAIPEGNAPNFGGDGTNEFEIPTMMPPSHRCRACGEDHPLGWCRLKIANVEHCGLCGMAHIGTGRTCPHLNDETQVATMLNTLKESTESRETIELATKYLRQVRGDLAWRKRNQEKKDLERQNQPFSTAPEYTYPQISPQMPTYGHA
ncbi:MAG: hypothetical protein Q9160_001838 [Pyrenula sp. 1 TL-2023]